MGVAHRPVGHLPSYPHPPKLKEIPTFLPQFSGVPVHLSPFRPSHGPTSLFNDCNGSEADDPHKGSQTSPIPGRLADRGPIPGGGTSEHSDSGRPDTVFRVDNQTREVRHQTHSMFSFMGYEYHLDSALVKPTRERWFKLQDLILHLKSKHDLTARCLMSLIGLLATTEKMVMERRLHMKPSQFYIKEHWRYSQLLDSLLPWSEAISAYLAQGFSVTVAERISGPQRSSTRTIYKSKCPLFERWCRENSLGFSTPSVKQVSHFFHVPVLISKQTPVDHWWL